MNYKDYEYSLLERGGVQIDGYSGNAEHVCIPAEINGNPVVNIAGYAFAFCDSIKTVIFPEGVCEIGMNAFESCTALCSAVLPKKCHRNR